MADDDQTRDLPPEEPEGKPGGGGPGEPAPQTPEGEPTHELPPAAEEPTREQPTPAAAPGPRRLKRSRDDRLIAGVCGGLGRYFGIDPVIFRVAAVALVFLGGAGALLYLAAILLVPDEGSDQQSGRSLSQRGLAITGVVLLVVAAGAIFSRGPFHFWPAWPLGFLLLFGLAIWWLATAERPSGSATGGDSPRKTGHRLLLGLLVLAASAVFAVGGAWLAGAGSVTAAGVAVLSAALMVGLGAFAGFGRWLILPALAFAIPVGVAMLLDFRGMPIKRIATTCGVVILAALPFLSLQLAFNKGVTGSFARAPHTLYLDTDQPDTTYGFHPYNPDAKPLSTIPVGVGTASRYVLEVPGGWAARRGVAPGQHVDLLGVPAV